MIQRETDLGISKEDLYFLCTLLKKYSGYNLEDDKSYLIMSRILPIMEKHGYNINELIEKLRQQNNDLITEIVEAVTIKETSFFRDIKPFRALDEIVIPHILKSNAPTKKIKILSIACSSGQEPYSIAMLMKENPKLNGWQCEIIATDISQNILNKAIAGSYTQFEVQRGMPITMLIKYFTKNKDHWNINDNIKSMVKFRQFNLLDDIAELGKDFDLVLCRNVLIYFDSETKSKTMLKLYNILNRKQFLFLGSSESTLGFCNKFTPFEGVAGLHTRND